MNAATARSARQMIGLGAIGLAAQCGENLLVVLGLDTLLSEEYSGGVVFPMYVDPDDPNTVILSLDPIIADPASAWVLSGDPSAPESTTTSTTLVDDEIRAVRDGDDRILITLDGHERPVTVDVASSMELSGDDTVLTFAYGPPAFVEPTPLVLRTSEEFEDAFGRLMGD